MKAHVRRFLIATFLAVAVLLPGTAQPAAAAVNPATVVAYIQRAYQLYRQFTGGGLSLAEATQQIIDAVNAAKVEIIAQIDLVASASAEACAHSAVIDVEDLPLFTPDNIQLFARDTTNCVTLIDALLGSVSDPFAVDQLGFALDSVGPIALLARTHAGFSTAALTTTLRRANTTVVDRLVPTNCWANPLWGDVPPGGGAVWVEIILGCSAYNGDVGQEWQWASLMWGEWVSPYWFDLTVPINNATWRTSRAAALAAFTLLGP